MRRLFGIFLLCFSVISVRASTVVFLGAAGDSEICAEAFRNLNLPHSIRFEYRCAGIDEFSALIRSAAEADVIVLNARSEELRRLAGGGHIDFSKTKLYALSARLLGKGIPAMEPPEMAAYRRNRGAGNFRNMVLWIIHRELDSSVSFGAPSNLPETGAVHPDSREIFSSISEYRKWAAENGRFRPDGGLVAIAVHSAGIHSRNLSMLRNLTGELERRGMNAVIVYGDEVKVIRDLLIRPDGKQTVDAVLAFSFKFKSGLGAELSRALEDLDLPVFNALHLYRQTTPEWKKSPRGMNDFSVAFGFIAPEISGLIEPSLLFGTKVVSDSAGRRVQVSEPFPEQIRYTAARLKKWISLRKKKNADKRIAVFIYNGAGGKQNIGASYLNVPRSLVNLVGTLAQAGYETGNLEKLSERDFTGELLKKARNIGPWAPGELEDLAANGEVVRLPKRKYLGWFESLPEDFRRTVIEEWGVPEKAGAMMLGGDFIIPVIRRGNLAVLPEPMRGWLGDPHKLVHSSTLAPPHQYLAVYLWLEHEFLADAMIHLGRHGSSEWLPGKQLGLSASDAPMIVRGDIPEIYPYISDGIGEGIVAKRRANAVMIDHMTPFLKVPDSAGFLSELKRRISDCQSADPSVRESRERNLRQFARKSGLSDRFDPDSPDWLRQLEDYAESRIAPAPFGLHSFGASLSEDEIRTMVSLMRKKTDSEAEKHLRRAGSDELRSLLHALNGGFIRPGPSGDPLRNESVLPVGRNFYSFDPALVPAPEAVETGVRLAEELLAREKEKLGRYPHTVGIVLWAGESVRTDGVNEALALALMGMRPLYDGNGRVSGVRPVPGAALNRPRIDVLITASGAYRDQFGGMIRLLNDARRQASVLNDAENFIRGGRAVFFPAPGTYGTRVNKLAGASGIWEKDDEIAAVYLKNMSHTMDDSGNFIEDSAALEIRLKSVETILHSRSGNVYGVTDIDDMYQYLGGLSLAVRKTAGKTPDALIADLRRRESPSLAGLKSFMGGELDSRLYSREWIQSQLKENYAGGKMFSRMADNLWGWQAAAPETVSSSDWNAMYEIYVGDRYRLDLKKFFSENGEWAFQSMTGRMLEAVRKQYWNADMKVQQDLAAQYARSVIRQGMACCDHTCNNPLLNQMVVNLVSMPGVLSPEMVMKFQAAVEKSGGKKLADQVADRRTLQKSLAESFRKKSNRESGREHSGSPEAREEGAVERADTVPVKGFRMKQEQFQSEKTNLSSSGLKWTVLFAVFLLIGIFSMGAFRSGR